MTNPILRLSLGRSVAFGFLILGLAGCAHTPRKSGGDSENIPAPKDIKEVLIQPGSLGPKQTGYIQKNPDTIVIQGKKLKNTQFDLPVVINSGVEEWVDYFTGRGRKYFEKYLDRSEFFIPYIEPLLKENGMPTDLVYLAMIESGFNNLAKSHAKAVGPWQFIAPTGKRYGLKVNWWIDERRDIRKSTLAAIEYLRDLFNMFQSWELAAAGYNAGEFKIARAIQRYGTRDFWALSTHRFLKPETRNYVPKIIAAAIVAKNREQFGFRGSHLHPAADEAVASDGEVVKLIKTDKPLEEGQDRLEEVLSSDLPPELSETDRKKMAQEVATRVRQADKEDADFEDDDDSADPNAPADTKAEVAQAAADKMADKVKDRQKDQPSNGGVVAKAVATPHVNKEGEVGGEQIVEFEVRTPADLLKVARASGLSYQTVKSLNPEVVRWCTPPPGVVGKPTYRVKLPVSVKETFLSAYNHPAFPKSVEFLTYTMRSGETLGRVARFFGIKVDPIAELNGISAHTALRRGTKIILPIPNDRSRSLASLEVRDPPEKGKKKKKSKSASHRVSRSKREAARRRGSSN